MEVIVASNTRKWLESKHMEIPFEEIAKLAKGRTEKEKIKLSLLFFLLFVLYLFYHHHVNIIRDVLAGSGFGFISESLLSFGLAEDLSNHLLVIFVFICIAVISSLYLYAVLYFLRQRPYGWSSQKGLSDWDFHGSITVDSDNGEKVIKIKSSQIGAIIKHRSWTNYVMSFEFKIPKKISYGPDPKQDQLERGFGIIFRAKSLGQYYMLKVDKSGYRPHINNNQYWEDLGSTIITSKPAQQWLDKWIPVRITMKSNVLQVNIGDDDFKLYLPSYSLVYRVFPEKHGGREEPTPFIPLVYRESGTVGFRSAPFEEVYVRRLRVNPYLLDRIQNKLGNIKQRLL